MNRTVLDLWVGFFVLLGVAALLFLALRVGNFSTSRSSENYMLEARFDNIGGLKVRGPVKSAGVVVGRVSGIRFDKQSYEAVVTLSLQGDYHFPKDTYASIYTAGILGEQYIGLDVGGDEKMLVAGDTITRTQSAVVLEKLVSQFLFSKAEEGSGKKK